MKSDGYCHFGDPREKNMFLILFEVRRIAIIKEKWSSDIIYYQIEPNLVI